jgi:UDP-GlcNAc:undecaprenyl-phosphate GlcNAc-1-phosphate transferase
VAHGLTARRALAKNAGASRAERTRAGSNEGNPRMYLLPIVAAVVGLVVASALTPVARAFARRVGAVDSPGGRRVHTNVTPRMGGLAVVGAHLLAIGVVVAYGGQLGAPEPLIFPSQRTPLMGFLAGGLVIALIGAVDDLRPIGAKRKLAGQVLVATIAWWAGARIEAFDLPWLGSVQFGLFASYVLTVSWIIAFVNAVNLIDGLDGLASGIVLFVAVTNTIVALATGNILAAVLNAALGGALAGFLFYNFNPATIFLGDTGSLYLGYSLGAAALLSGRQKESTLAALLVPLVALGVPLTDTLFTMVRRFLERRSIFVADRGHIHHRLLDLGLTHRRVVLLLYGLTVLTCASALVAAFGKNWVVGGAIAAAAAVILGGAAFAGYFRTQLRRERAPLSAEAQLVREALPRLLLPSPESDVTALCARIETMVLTEGRFVAADVMADSGVVWRWASGSAPSKDDVEYVYSWTTSGLGVKARFVVRGDGTERCARLDVLLQLLADRIEKDLELPPVGAPAPSPSRPMGAPTTSAASVGG